MNIEGIKDLNLSDLNEKYFFLFILDRHTDIVKLKQELKKKDELRDAAKISHNILVEKLRVAEAKLKRVQGQSTFIYASQISLVKFRRVYGPHRRPVADLTLRKLILRLFNEQST